MEIDSTESNACDSLTGGSFASELGVSVHMDFDY